MKRTYKNATVILKENNFPIHEDDQSTVTRSLNVKCSEALEQALDGNQILFATDSSKDDIVYVRSSALTDKQWSVLHNLIDNNKQWLAYPKRSVSIVCSTARNPQQNSTVYVVLPINGTKLGICPEFNFSESFKQAERLFGCKDILEFQKQLMQVLNTVEKFVHDKSLSQNPSIDDINRVCTMYDNIMKTFQGFHDFKLLLTTTTDVDPDNWIVKDGGLFQKIEHVLDPVLNGFEVSKISGLSSIKNKEVWFTNDCYMIRKSVFNKLVDSGKLSHIENTNQGTR